MPPPRGFGGCAPERIKTGGELASPETRQRVGARSQAWPQVTGVGKRKRAGGTPPHPDFSPPSLARGSLGFRVPLAAGLQEFPPRPLICFLWGDTHQAPERGLQPRERGKGGAGGRSPPDGEVGGVPPRKQKWGASWHLLKPGHEWAPKARLSRR